ncbi:hypothetical protein PAHAL_3G117500 [Panicum hallii]|uniref:Uncharacterized protein n=1 Tax=Panicum hallii TaxID=206008 RepID=A0A2S3H805_9POAL|nr:hypothetical protein PAHAL_3G117500 [Panicum hallii]
MGLGTFRIYYSGCQFSFSGHLQISIPTLPSSTPGGLSLDSCSLLFIHRPIII